ncbi:choice-of-anchor D domain-containing protein [Winogradskyella sp.]|uniref:choice-of-anchor D domain-containing protein n=1 Tax=Winogradskyella sp. TaxID=1883156 RepID=UPI003AB7B237
MIKNYLFSFILFCCAFNFGYGQTFNEVTTLGDLTNGNYLIVEYDANASANVALMENSTAGSIYIDYTYITNPGAAITTGYSANNIFNITVSGGNITIYNSSVGYVSYGRNPATANDADFFNGTIDDRERWTPTVSGGEWSLSNVQFTARILQWNNSSPRFAAYTSNQVKLRLFKQVTAPCVAPTSQPTSLVLNNITSSSIDGAFTAASSDDYLIVASTSATLSGNPVDGTSYYTGDSLGGGTVVQSSSATTFTASGLSQTTPYYFFVFAFNDSGCSGGPLYYTTSPLNGTATTITGPCASESFVNAGDDGSYGLITWTGDNSVDWTASDALSNIDLGASEAVILRSNNGGTLSNDNPIAGGCGVITFNYARVYSGESTFQVWINGSQYGGDVTTTTSAPSTFSATVNVPGNISVEIRNVSSSAGKRFIISDLSWTCYSGTPNPELQLIDDASVDQNCGYTIDFGTTGSSFGTTDRTFVIENRGTVDLDVTSIPVSGTDAGDFTIISPAIPFSVAPSSTQTVTVQFAPATNGTKTAELTINNNDIDEGACVINLTGEGVTPIPEIRVETNSGNNIPDNAGIAPVYNNNFGNQTESTTSAPKTYLIVNLGTGDLDISSITVSTTDFTISSNPAPTTLAPGDSTPVLITFNPSTPGTKNATVTINNTDPDENPFRFAVTGNGICGSSTMTISPDSGPANTVVTITDLSYDISTATATFNGTPLTVTAVTANEIEITIPAGEPTGNILVTNSFGCESTFLFNVIDNTIGGCEGSSILGEIFISEITDATYGGLSYIELYNATGAPVDLSDYTLDLYKNGNTDNTDTNNYKTRTLSGTIGINQTFVIATGVDAYPCPQPGGDASYADLITTMEGINKPANGHDFLGIYKSGVLIDAFGVFGDNNWMSSVHTTISGNKGFNFRRLNTATPLPNPTFDDDDWNIIDWAGGGASSCSVNDFSDIVNGFDFSTGTPPIVNSIASTTTACNETTISVSASEGFSGGNDLRYYWYFYNPAQAGLGWQAISTGGIFTTVDTSPDLIISDSPTAANYQFYCEVREDSASCYAASNAIKITLSTATWDGNWNWNDGTPLNTVPDLSTNVVINANYDTSVGGSQTSFKACSLTVNSPFNLAIQNNNYIEIQNNIVANGNITVQSQGSVVQINDLATVTGGGVITVQKETTTLTDAYNYTYWSSPVAGETVENVFANVSPSRRFIFNAANFIDLLEEIDNTNTFVSGQDDIDDDGDDWQIASGIMTPGVGYAATASIFGPFPASQQFPFVGPFNNGVYTPTIVNNSGGVYNDWNFIGNPYPSAIDTNRFFTVNTGITNNIYLWSQATPLNANAIGNEGENFSGADYAIINASGVNVAGGDGVIPNDFVPSGQGFFIEAISGTNITFNNSMRVTGNNNQFFRNNTQRNVLWLNLSSDNGAAKQIAVAHLQGATDNNDGSYYDVKENLSSGNAATIYSTILDSADEQFVIQGKDITSLDENEVIHIGFKTIITTPTLYKISIAQFEGEFYTANNIYLKDNLLNTYHNLKDSDYTFTSESGEYNNRFEIVFRTANLSIEDHLIHANGISITELTNGDVEFKLNSNQNTITNVEILDMLGRRVYNLRGNTTTEVYNLSQLSQSAYIAKITLSNGQVISKKAIKQQ